MSSTYSTNLAIELIGTGDQAGTWGNTTNTNLGTLIEQAISGYVTQAVATGTDTTITIPNGASGVARNMFIELTGTGGASTNLIVPNNKKLYFVYNNTSSGQVTVKVSGQTGVSVANGAKVILVSNGTDVIAATSYSTTDGTGSTNYVSKFTSSTSIGSSIIYDTGTNVGINTASPQAALDIVSTGGSGGLVIQGGSPVYRASSITFDYDVNTSDINSCGPNTSTVSNLNFVLLNSNATLSSTPLQLFADGSTYANGYFWANQIETNSLYSYGGIQADSSIYSNNNIVTTGGYIVCDPQYGYIGVGGVILHDVSYYSGYGTYNVSLGGLNNLSSSTSAAHNIAIGGEGVLFNATYGGFNTAIGTRALYNSTTGSSSVSIGYYSLYNNNGGNNVAIGNFALQNNYSGYNNTAVGINAGGAAVNSAGNNTFIGAGSGASVTGSYNTYIGTYQGTFGVNLASLSYCIALSDGSGNLRQYYNGTSNFWAWLTSGTERMRLDSNGNLLVAQTAVDLQNSNSYSFRAGSSGGYETINHISGTGSGTYYAVFGYNAGLIGSITQNGTTGVLYNITSDYRLKTFVAQVSGSGERIDALNPVEFEWKSDGSRARGFFAHEFQSVYAYSVTGEKDAVDADGNPVYQQMQASTNEVIADLVAELKSLRARVAQLESK